MVHERDDITTPLWRWSDLLDVLGSSASEDHRGPGGVDPQIHRVHMDSRTIEPGDLFVALSGDPGARFNPSYRSSVDGHDFVEQAFQAGAAGVVQTHEVISVSELVIGQTLGSVVHRMSGNRRSL